MSLFYKPRRSSNFFDPKSKTPFKLSRFKIELFLECPRCFYLDRRLGIDRPSGPSFSLNSAVDTLLKKEFDIHRAGKKTHFLMESYGLDAIPFSHPKIEDWRNVFKGIQVLHSPTNLLIYGAIDDIWINKKKDLFIVDYKATSTEKEITLDDKWKQVYKRQMEVYQWLARNSADFKGYNISKTGYFVYCNGRKDSKAFDGKLEFDIKLIPYNGNADWVEKEIINAKNCLMQNNIPQMNEDCDFCRWREEVLKEL